MAFKKSTSILIVGLMVLGGFALFATAMTKNVKACNNASFSINGTQLFFDGNNGNQNLQVNAPGTPNYVWSYGSSYWYDARLQITPGCGAMYEVKFSIITAKPDGWTVDILDNTPGKGITDGASIDGIMMGDVNSQKDGFYNTVDYHAKFILIPPATGHGDDIIIKLRVHTKDTACNDDDNYDVLFQGTIGPPNVLPTITLSQPAAGA